MKILLASIPVPGHLNPILGLGRILMKHNHEVLVQTGAAMQSMVEAAGMPCVPLLPEADIDALKYFEMHPERQEKTPGIEMISFDLQHYFMPALAAQTAGLRVAAREFSAHLIVTDSLFWGTLPLLLGQREQRPAIAHLGISVLNVGSGKSMPPKADASAERLRTEHDERERVLLRPVQAAFNEELAKMGSRAIPCPVLEAMSTLPDLYLHPGIESFQYSAVSHSSSPVRYIGPLPLPPAQYSLPEWWHELDESKRLVLVTQGTVANWDFGQLVGPTLTALAEEKDLIVLVTTGGQPSDSIPVEIPANARVAQFLPYDLVLPQVDLLITNGGYGTVNMALSHGVPIVSAGLTEDKEEVSAHVQWSGAGIDLRTNQADPEAVRTAAREILDSSGCRDRARELAFEFKRHDTEAELLELVEACAMETTA
ncbi:MAG TPA: glycosyltransferase [Pseudacidobacterium sp.]|jgi:MGT family glycosyltransferase|nr:glycosyltransferase [Pseudacidobacterium sp.]